jgi:hypothetical protein
VVVDGCEEALGGEVPVEHRARPLVQMGTSRALGHLWIYS